MSAEKIEPCPFCANTDPEIDEVELGIWAIVCGCGCTGPIEKFNEGTAQTPAKAIQLWNQRPAKPS